MSDSVNNVILYGARFYACDLHVHTPCDREWLGQKPSANDWDRKDYAKQFVDACLKHGLEVIGLVDHNFARSPAESLEPLIKEEAERQGLVVFPGVELASSEGIHLVLLLDPQKDFNEVERLVASVFVPSERSDSNGSPLPAPLNLEQLLAGLYKLCRPEHGRSIGDRALDRGSICMT